MTTYTGFTKTSTPYFALGGAVLFVAGVAWVAHAGNKSDQSTTDVQSPKTARYNLHVASPKELADTFTSQIRDDPQPTPLERRHRPLRSHPLH